MQPHLQLVIEVLLRHLLPLLLLPFGLERDNIPLLPFLVANDGTRRRLLLLFHLTAGVEGDLAQIQNQLLAVSIAEISRNDELWCLFCVEILIQEPTKIN